MAFDILLAIPESDALVTRQATAILDESDILSYAGHVTHSSEVAALLDDANVDIVVLHERLGPLPVLDLANDLTRRYPDVSIVLLAEDHTSELLRGAMFAGVRALVPLPLTVEELTGAIWNAGEWSTSVRQRIRDDGSSRARQTGDLITLAGAKGGVGTTTIAVLLARQLLERHPDRKVCLVDLDLQAGDVRAMLDLTHRRSITDLVAVAEELTTRHLDDALFTHSSGLEVLLPPIDGELGEDVHVAAARRIFGALRTRFDTVIVDVGTTMNDATAVAVELATVPLVVTQTDVPSLRGANRLLSLWERLAIRKGDVRVVVNRTHRDNEIQPDLCARVVKAPLLKATIPARFRDLEPIVNTGDPSRLTDPLVTALDALAEEIFTVEAAASDDGETADLEKRVTAAAGDTSSGQASVEFLAVAPLLALTLLFLWQIVLFGWGQVMVQQASREGAAQLAISAREATTADGAYVDVYEAAHNDILAGWGGLEVTHSADRVRVEAAVPVIHPVFGSIGQVSSSAGAYIEERPS